MKKSLFYSFVVCMCAAGVLAENAEPERVRVTGDRVSLRARPDRNSELLDRTSEGDVLTCVGETTNGWVAVDAPTNLNFWVFGDFVKEGKVTAKKLNIRSGPSQNYSVMAVVKRGSEVDLRGEHDDWLKIGPPAGSKVWISDQFVEPLVPKKVEPPKPDPVKLAQQEMNKMSQQITELERRLQREKIEKARAMAEAEKVKAANKPPVVKKIPQAPRGTEPLLLKLDKNKPQNTYDEIPGVLQPANPGLYQLVLISGDMAEPICLVRGEKKQMEEYRNRSLLIKGYINWIEGVDLPMIRPVKIVVDPILED